MRNAAAGIVLVSLVLYFFVFLYVCYLTGCFWRNKDAHKNRNNIFLSELGMAL